MIHRLRLAFYFWWYVQIIPAPSYASWLTEAVYYYTNRYHLFNLLEAKRLGILQIFLSGISPYFVATVPELCHVRKLKKYSQKKQQTTTGNK